MTVFQANADGALEFCGDFDALYTNERDPWGQSGQGGPLDDYYAFSRQRLAARIRALIGTGSVLEVGCGHGHVVDYLKRNLFGSRVSGMDISSAALDGAQSRYPMHTFSHGDIADPHQVMWGCYDIVVVNQVWWYILERLDIALGNCWQLLNANGLLLVSQAFLPAGEQRYGTEIADGFPGALRVLLDNERFTLIEASYDDIGRDNRHDGLLTLRRR